ncbi:hypothetical protein RDABS01_011378 [Bienertia sinuspersici]
MKSAMAIVRASEDEHNRYINGVEDEDKNTNHYTEDELQVANVLLELRYSIKKLNPKHKAKAAVMCSSYGFEYNWITRKRRSERGKSPNRKIKAKEQAPSPKTPLSFSPSETDSTPNKKTTPLLLRKKELKKAVKDRVQTQRQLKESIEKVQEYLKTIIAENSALKAKKRELVMGEKGEKQRLKATSSITADSTLQIQVKQSPLIHPDHRIIGVNLNEWGPSPSTQLEQQPPLINPYQCRHHHDGAATVLSNDPVYAGPSKFHHQQPLILHQAYPMVQYQRKQVSMVQIDLNLLPSPDEEQMMIRRVEAGEARKNRMRVNKEKKTRVRTTA